MSKVPSVRENKEPLRYEHFQADQNIYIQKTLNRIKTTWIGNIRDIVDREVIKTNVHWFNFDETSRDNYEHSKTKKYFKRVSLIMEDAVRILCQRSFKNFFNYINSFIPEKVEIKSANNVANYYADGSTIDSTNPSTFNSAKANMPLFETDLMRHLDDSCFSYATPPTNFMNLLLGLFDRMIEEMSKIPDVEQKCLPEIMKKRDRSERYLTSPSRQNESAFDNNQWVRDLYE